MKKYTEIFIFFYVIIMLCCNHYWINSPNRIAGKSRPWNNYGVALFADGQVEAAFEAFKKASAINKNDKDTINNIGYYYFVKRDYNKAVFCFRRALAIPPADTNIMINLGAAFISNGQFEEGLESYLNAIKKDQTEMNGAYLTKMHLPKFAAACEHLLNNHKEYKLVAEYTGKVNEIINN